MVKIEIENSIFCKTDKDGRKTLAPCLIYRKTYWRQTQHKKIENQYNVCLIDNSGRFLTGFLPRIVEYSRKKDIKLKISGWKPTVMPTNEKNFNKFLLSVKAILGKNFRPDLLKVQKKLIRLAIERQRGVLLSPTGTGKTTLALGIASLFPNKKILYLCHTKTLVTQTSNEFKKFGFKTTSIMEGKEDQSGNVVVATRQSMVKLTPEKYDILMIDEVHHLSNVKSEYGKICEQIFAPIKIGFTAKLTDSKAANLAIEGHIGAVIGELTMETAEDMNILAKTKLRIIKIPKQFLESNKYEDVHREAIIESRVRNRLIVKVAKEYVDKGNSVLIFVINIDHIIELLYIADIYKFKMHVVDGSVGAEKREQIKNDFQDKKIKCVISTVVWKEGVNIPSLNVIIMADIGKKDHSVIQIIGRGKRRTTEKHDMVVIDFFDDSSIHLIRQFGHRLCLYSEEGWL